MRDPEGWFAEGRVRAFFQLGSHRIIYYRKGEHQYLFRYLDSEWQRALRGVTETVYQSGGHFSFGDAVKVHVFMRSQHLDCVSSNPIGVDHGSRQ